MTPEQFKNAQYRMAMTNQGLADFLGLSRCTVQLYRAGTQPVPKPVAMTLRLYTQCCDMIDALRLQGKDDLADMNTNILRKSCGIK